MGYREVFLISAGLLFASAAVFAAHLGLRRREELQSQGVPAR